MKRGIDVSRWNAIRDYDALKRSGVEFAIVKVNNAGNCSRHEIPRTYGRI